MQKEIHLNETEWKKFTNVEKKNLAKVFFTPSFILAIWLSRIYILGVLRSSGT